MPENTSLWAGTEEAVRAGFGVELGVVVGFSV
jgi:hypothetical protein